MTPAQILASQIAALLDRAQVEDYRYPGGGNGFREQIAALRRAQGEGDG